MAAEQELISHLTRDEKTEGSGEVRSLPTPGLLLTTCSQGAADFTAAIQFRDLVHAFTLSTTRLDRFSPAQQTNSKEGRRAKALNVRYEDLCMSFWQANAANDVFAPRYVTSFRSHPLILLLQCCWRPASSGQHCSEPCALSTPRCDVHAAPATDPRGVRVYRCLVQDQGPPRDQSRRRPGSRPLLQRASTDTPCAC